MSNQAHSNVVNEQNERQYAQNSSKRMSRIQFSGISKSYSRKDVFLSRLLSSKKHSSKHILKDVELDLNGGECILLTGKNGSGKSTLFRILAGLLKPDTATISTGLDSQSWKKSRKTIRQHVMYLYQEPYMFEGSVTRNLKYALTGSKNAPKTDSSTIEKQIKDALKWANLEHRADTSAKCLSGGERQRVALAQAWLKHPSVLLLDEPTANMDTESRLATEALLSKFKSSGTALLIASHDVNHFEQITDKHLFLEDGIIHEISTNVSAKTNESVLENINNVAGSNASNVSPFPTKKINS